MSSFSRKFVRTVALGLTAVVALATCLISPSFAQRDPLDLAQAGFVAKDRGDFTLAIRLFDEALQRGLFSDKQRGLLLYTRGVSNEALGRRDRALSDFDAAIALLPEFPNAYLYRGIIWGDEREYQRALQDFLTASKLNPGDPLVFNNLGNVYEKLGELDRAIENYGLAIRLRSDYAPAYYNRARTYVLKQDEERAIADYDKAIALQPTYEDAYVNRAVLHVSRRDIKSALADLDTAIRLNPRDVAALSNRASVNLAIEKYAEALSDFDRALTVDPGNAATYLGRGRAHLFSGAVDDSIEDFKTAVRLRPSNPYPIIWLHIARVHKGESDRDEFEANVKAANRETWPGAMLDMYLGLLAADEVKAAAQRGTDRDKSKRECEASFFLGELALHNGQTQQARDALREVTLSCGPAETVYSAAVAEAKLLPRQ
ncbi:MULTISPECIES: tetratricopeptide repeat protein [Bradyrhizobium]|uniref:Tetratricopeptide repeat protein n=2 Tax=Pseudomonadota TaxID=1224 RepID=A0ABS5G2A3_9BRAD|nr:MULTISPECIES: tetratricopeptide repeat protein [Bradyrhizobium]MBR1135204.1 tetratricopeptide repeat protein [Bradyrhizobium denitrificans]MDU1497468.1 tetratricopeptide repeat protein [Bradyrhizobium sp.]MDU1547725.1 tetratricopeptide repeat protein [Bradyrhizobium sp.]MDU1694098.1 tetratricopeptide repeat protein [Bradyrhizobium sp.]MDU1806615.1 tetratricopeptide repeat protein [Bradyrhizobium sp.]